MASSSKLTQDCKPFGYSLLLKSFGNQLDQSQKLEEFLSRLEEEWLKIEAFKRELPLCMQLLSNAMEDSRQQLQTYQANQGTRPVLEEFIPLKNSSSEESDRASSISEKASWMVSAQLWSQSNDGNKQQTTTSPKETNQCLSPKLGLDDKKRNGGAFLPFSKERNTCNTSPVLRVLPELALASSEKDMDDKKCSKLDNNGVSCSRLENSNKSNNGVSTMNDQVKGVGNQGETQSGTTDSQTHRKARRCWSPDLHRRFLNALQMLGGSQVATPKQIRELMKVDGLTNDEVKSHLQKYRLHTRRPSHSPQAAGAQAPQLVVLGSIWMPPEYATAAAHNGGPAMYSAHPASLASPHYCTPAIPQDFYPAPPLPPHHQLHHHNLLQHHHHHHHHQMYKDSTQTHSSPDSDLRGGGRGDRSESIEDGKSDSGSWKGGGRGDSGGENGSGERRGLASLRDEAENTTTNGNEIILKF